MPSAWIVCSGIVERIGLEDAVIAHKTFPQGKEEVTRTVMEINGHAEGLQEVARLLTDPVIGVIRNPAEIDVVGHRVVHGGESFAATTIITSGVKEQIKKLFALAPLHNPPNYLGIEVAEKIFATAQQVAVFDTAFHQTLPALAYRYAIPSKFYHEYGIRAYGFHGTSHKYVSDRAIKYLQKAHTKIITIHLGNGCSMTAVDNGQSVETTMGFGPMNGLVMGTRCGDIDQSIIFYLVNHLGYDIENVNAILNKKSGMIGLSGFSDMRDIKREIDNGNQEALLAYQIYAYRIRKYIGSYTAVLNGLDAIVFTGGVGENDTLMRKLCLTRLEYLGIEPDDARNEAPSNGFRQIHSDSSKVKLLVIPTNEELEIATQCHQLLNLK